MALPTRHAMPHTDDHLHDALARTDATLSEVVRRAGRGLEPELERQLDAHLRGLRAVLPDADTCAAEATIEAAKRVADSAEPEAPLLMLAMARDQLTRVVQRRARSRRRPAAA
ncbi:hypothetical protein N800_07600 [Lysobacter daejeonensis GH1-9]|uniref:Uncharacterized protein n=2 Tax=Aerolutibacter TaxID=3382701 RepID=A0A0A0ET81_9GAMM|nr:hypothetical protein N800_07600 [Lysobacter daejeonensis GH1-9]